MRTVSGCLKTAHNNTLWVIYRCFELWEKTRIKSQQQGKNKPPEHEETELPTEPPGSEFLLSKRTHVNIPALRTFI